MCRYDWILLSFHKVFRSFQFSEETPNALYGTRVFLEPRFWMLLNKYLFLWKPRNQYFLRHTFTSFVETNTELINFCKLLFLCVRYFEFVLVSGIVENKVFKMCFVVLHNMYCAVSKIVGNSRSRTCFRFSGLINYTKKSSWDAV